jgi:hypothetical protein
VSPEDELLAAWTAWDRTSAQIGAVARRALDAGGRPPRCPTYTLEAESRRLVAAERALGLPLGWCTRVGSFRWWPDGRERMDPASAVQHVLNEHAAGTLTAALTV